MATRGRGGFIVLGGVLVALLTGLVVLELRHDGGVRGFVEDDLLPQLGREPKREGLSIIEPSRGLRNCRVGMVPFGAKELSFGAIDGKPGHFVALVTTGGRVTLSLECPKNGATNPQAEKYEVLAKMDRFSWTIEPNHQTLPMRIRWLHRGGDEDNLTIEWHAR
jgi:hypothetical protein